jgi:hypothetical protein
MTVSQIQELHLVLHGLAIKKHASAAAVAGIVGLDPARAAALLADAARRGRAIEAQGKFLLAPAARMSLEAEYSRVYADLRANPAFLAAYETFERVNSALKSLITDWQTMEVGGEVGGERIANDHSDAAYDERIIDRLGELHERSDGFFAGLAAGLPRLQIYQAKLLQALEKAEDGAVEWVSDARIESYHTVWFELHEDLLRILGRQRVE